MNKYIFLILTLTLMMKGEIISQNESMLLDSFEIHKKYLEMNYEIEFNEFDSLLNKLGKYGDIHEYVLNRIAENRRTPIMHEYYPAYLSFLCGNMDSIYQQRIIEIIESDSIERYLAYPIVKSCLFQSDKETCEFLNAQELEEKFVSTKSLMFESLINLKKELKCSM